MKIPCTECEELLDTEAQNSWLEHHDLKHCPRTEICKCGWELEENDR